MDMFPFDDGQWFPVVSKIMDQGVLKPPKFNKDCGMWICTFTHNQTKELKQTFGDDAPTCILRLWKQLFPNVNPWQS